MDHGIEDQSPKTEERTAPGTAHDLHDAARLSTAQGGTGSRDRYAGGKQGNRAASILPAYFGTNQEKGRTLMTPSFRG